MVLSQLRRLDRDRFEIALLTLSDDRSALGAGSLPEDVPLLTASFRSHVVLAGVKGFKPIPDFVSDKVVMKEIQIRGAIGVTSTGYRSAIRLIESHKYPLEKMHTHDFALRDAELAIKTLARQIEGDESIHSCLLPGG